MNIQQIQYVLAVAELKNFGKAAEKCFITQSTLSTMIVRFEEEIGITIFDRKTKPATISKEGEEIIRQLKLIATEINKLNEIAESLKGEITGNLKIGVIPTVAPYILPHFLEDFTGKFPKMDFEISEITTAVIIDSLIKRELDVGIVSIPLEQSDLLEIPLYNETFVLYDCQSKNGRKLQIEDIDHERLWLLEEGHCLRTQVQKICDFDQDTVRVNSNFKYKSGTIDSLMRFVKMNKGITFLPYLATLEFNKEDQKKINNFEAPIPVRTIGLIYHKHFVKKQVLEELKLNIQNKIIPLLKKNNPLKEKILNPI